ncbi:MAG: aryl-sulfate sulfotransferase [Ekhidna sp.]|nr:aryl-sulfate sulfotransferase [Ekhidna sp.]
MKNFIYSAGLILIISLVGCNGDDDGIEPEVITKPESVIFKIQKDEDTNEDYQINPFDHAPMTAGIEFSLTSEEENVKVAATVTIKGQKGAPDFTKEYSLEPDSENNQWLPIIGMYNGNNTVDVALKTGADSTVFSQTYTIAISIPTEGLGKAAEAQISGNFAGDEMIFAQYNISERGQDFTGIIYDLSGNIRWYSDIPNSFMQFVLNSRIYVGYKGERINRLGVYDFMGNQVEDWELPGWEDVHHDLIANELGNLVMTVSKDDESPVEQHLIELNPNSRQDNKVVNGMDLSLIFPNVDELFPDLPRGELGGNRLDHVHNNSLSSYKRGGQTVYLCGSQRSGIAAIDQNGFPQWYLFPRNVQYKDFNDSESEARMPAAGNFPRLDYDEPPSYKTLLVKPVDDNGELINDTEVTDEGKVKPGVKFVYPFRQHGARVIDYDNNSVTFLVLDNGLFRGFETHTTTASSRAVCYKVTFPEDTSEAYGGKVQQIWSTDMEFFSPFLGQSYKTPSGNYIFTFGSIGSRALTTGDTFNYNNSSDTEMKTVIVEFNSSGKEQGRLTIPTTNQSFGVGTYRAERIKL